MALKILIPTFVSIIFQGKCYLFRFKASNLKVLISAKKVILSYKMEYFLFKKSNIIQ